MPEEPPSPTGRRFSPYRWRSRVTLNSIARRLPRLIPFAVGCFIVGVYSLDLHAAWALRTTPQSSGDAERVAFTLGSYLRPDTLQAAANENELITVALAGENIGGQAGDEPQPIQTHVVMGGETLSTIAEKYSLRMGSVVLANTGIDTETIHPGQVLTIPDSDASDAELEKEWQERQAKQRVAKAPVTKRTTLSSQKAGSSTSFGSPISARYVSQGFSASHPGKDFVASPGTPVRAIASGCVIVASSGYNGGYGTTLVVNLGGGFTARYAHLRAFARGISAGSCYDKGDIIAYSGNTGRSTGPHLHFEIHLNGVAKNPGAYGL